MNVPWRRIRTGWGASSRRRTAASTTVRWHYAISGLPEARAYLAHPVLGPRLVRAARILAELDATDPVAVLGPVDAQKLRSSMTLFARAAPREPVFPAVLDRYFAGEQDPATLARL